MKIEITEKGKLVHRVATMKASLISGACEPSFLEHMDWAMEKLKVSEDEIYQEVLATGRIRPHRMSK